MVDTVLGAQPTSSDTAPSGHRTLFYLSLMLFFAWGFATVLLDILVPKFRGLFELSFAEAMLTQFAFFLGYFVFSLPAGAIVARLGYMRGIVAGLLVMATGCLLFVPAGQLAVYPAFLVALFVMAAGITILQVAANAVISLAGKAESSSARLTLAQAFNSFGTFIGPYVGAKLILEGSVANESGAAAVAVDPAVRAAELATLQTPYIVIGAGLLLIALIFFVRRNLLGDSLRPEPPKGLGLDLLRDRRLLFGVIAIFTYVGAEVSIGSLLVNYLSQPGVLGVTAVNAGKLVALYWGGAMIGRFAGAALLSRISAGKLLAVFAAVAMLLAALSGMSSGMIAAVTILGIGLFNSIMFPTIFSQAVRDLGDRASQGAALLCMGIVGGALLPVATGVVADRFGLAVSLAVPILGYAWVLFYGRYLARADAMAG